MFEPANRATHPTCLIF